ncbi:hypothetical protein PHLGIDRAFT_66093 [Phlebiopsis gigantea 11061_1 CR5-6]|uniref:YTH domain-containing protein n=1 Tax=Phlebiopsis gigantea (strain 11061_1 CR5-6) TaxID=745531 RepID=A0A0C3SE34_PHLG1|nr:hypothetical protein PHLGIDRAFT_66093 [Phlebiopsis gigantea 11061_1 CR5-6]
MSSSTTTPGLFSAPPSSHTLLSNPGTSQSPYTPPTPYTARYPTPPFVYPPHTYAHSGSPLYQGQFSYGQQYRPPIPAEQDQGTWWYLPSGTRPAPSPHYHAYDNPYPSIHTLYPPIREGEPYRLTQQTGPPSSLYPMAPHPQHLEQPSTISSPSQPQMQSPPGPDPPPPPGEPSSRSMSDLPRSEAPSTVHRQQHRRSYHPNPPANRSDWVMWAGNVPSDATHDELWRFFNSPPAPSPPAGSTQTRVGDAAPRGSIHGGVSSIHLISRSNCAFVNFETEGHLQAAIAHFNGQQLRASDPRCPRLVCRIRAREDDLRAGVGGQRGAGIHVRYVRDQKQKQARAKAVSSQETSSSEASVSSLEDPMAALSLSSNKKGTHARRFRKPAPHSSSSGSFASTNSSMLTQYFPKRYFILKSLTQFDLDLSVEKGLWATQRHNEGVLDQAYRTSKAVYLIFGVNKSGEFYGYAKMAGPVLRNRSNEHKVSWASRSSADSSSRRTSLSTQDSASPRAPRAQYFSPSDGNRFEESPLPIEDVSEASARPVLPAESHTAPAILHGPHRPLSAYSPGVPRHGELSYQDVPTVAPGAPAIVGHLGRRDQGDFELDPQAPVRAAKQRSSDAVADADGVKHWDAVGSLSAVREEEQSFRSPPSRPAAPKGKAPSGAADDGADKDEGPVWGDSFQIEWVRTNRLPFYRTRHLRNPWNHDREIKVSRDGTELEPSVGQALLDEWDKPEPAPSPQLSGTKSAPPE